MDKTEIYRAQNFGNRLGFGSRPALLIVDFVNGFNDPELLGGGNIADAIGHTADFLPIARECRLPICFTRIVYEPDGANAGAFAKKLPTLLELTEDNPASQVVPSLVPRTAEHVVRKTQASAFFGTDLAAWLRWRRVDTILIAGCTTSGCVRASVVDGISHNFRPIVIRECVGDRAQEPHEANLFDMQAKYADVLGKDDVVSHLRKHHR